MAGIATRVLLRGPLHLHQLPRLRVALAALRGAKIIRRASGLQVSPNWRGREAQHSQCRIGSLGGFVRQSYRSQARDPVVQYRTLKLAALSVQSKPEIWLKCKQMARDLSCFICLPKRSKSGNKRAEGESNGFISPDSGACLGQGFLIISIDIVAWASSPSRQNMRASSGEWRRPCYNIDRPHFAVWPDIPKKEPTLLLQPTIRVPSTSATNSAMMTGVSDDERSRTVIRRVGETGT